jgi:hypothetical protein
VRDPDDTQRMAEAAAQSPIAGLPALRKAGGFFLVGTPRPLLRKVEAQLLEENWTKVREGIEVKRLQALSELLRPVLDEQRAGEQDPRLDQTAFDALVVSRLGGVILPGATLSDETNESGRVANAEL